ncbi:hypothetical protein FGG78_16470 [Thioclava sp. BHET1]|nr:hypothetical protein FGG78_16470 [Thioclava sp. BHET1]
MAKLLFTTLAGIFVVMIVFGRDMPGQKDAGQAVAETTQASAPQAIDPQPAAARIPAAKKAETAILQQASFESPQSYSATPAVDSQTAATVSNASVISPVFKTSRMPGPALSPSPEYSATAAPKIDGGSLWEVSANALNVRSGPATSHQAVDSLHRGEQVLLVAEQGGWAHVKIEGDGIDGWVSKRFLSPAR